MSLFVVFSSLFVSDIPTTTSLLPLAFPVDPVHRFSHASVSIPTILMEGEETRDVLIFYVAGDPLYHHGLN